MHEAIKEKFLERLSARLREAVIGDPLDEATNFGPMVSERQMKIVQDYIEIGKSEGARLICGGGVWIATDFILNRRSLQMCVMT